MDEKDRLDLLKSEYLHIQTVIEGFDAKALTIKAWSITFSFTVLVGAFATKTPLAFLIASLSALMFWLIEGLWKTFQDAYYPRAAKLEEYFAGERTDIVPMQIASDWYPHWREGGTKKLFMIMRWPHVALPHIVVFLGGIVLFILNKAEVFQF